MQAPCWVLELVSGCPALIKSHFGETEPLPNLFPSSLQTFPERQGEKLWDMVQHPSPRITSLCPGDHEESPWESNTNALTWPKGSSSVPALG